MSTKEIQEQLVSTMRTWQKVENASIASTGNILAKTDNPIVRLILEIIQRDSQLHYRVQELLVSSLTEQAISLSPEELGDIWDQIEQHLEIENRTISLAKELLEALAGKKMVVQEYLIQYLLQDEEKHSRLLSDLDKIKGGMYPYG